MSKVRFEDVCNESFYYFNRKALTFGGVWYSWDSGGWYMDQYQLDENGSVIDEDGALWEVEVDDDGYIIDGYTSVDEVYRETMWCGKSNIEIDSDMFSRLKAVADDAIDVKLRFRSILNVIA